MESRKEEKKERKKEGKTAWRNDFMPHDSGDKCTEPLYKLVIPILKLVRN